jgi:predicted small lipoprotein YifL
MFKKFGTFGIALALVTITVGGLNGCGRKGALTLPKQSVVYLEWSLSRV